MNTVIDFLSPLNQLCEDWEECRIEWSNIEGLEKIEYINDEFPTRLVSKFDTKVLWNLATIYQGALLFRVNIGDNPVFNLRPDVNESDVQQLNKDVSASQRNVRLLIRIDKARLADLYYSVICSQIEDPKCVYLYLSGNRFCEYLKNCRLDNLEKNVWREQANSTVLCLLPYEDVILSGPWLIIVGGKYITKDIISKNRSKFDQEKILGDKAYEICRKNLNWQDSWIKQLTPWHLYLDSPIESWHPIQDRIGMHFGNLSLLYSADLTYSQQVNEKNILVSRFNSPDKNVEILHISEPSNIRISPEYTTHIKSILDWIYDPQWQAGDRLMLAQQNIVDSLAYIPSNQRWQEFFRHSKDIRQNIEWHWETFTHEKIGDYLDVVKDLDDYFNQIAKGFSENIDSIQKSLTETMLAAIAVLIGSFIASLFQTPFNPAIFRIGMIIYAIYVFFFPLIYNMVAQWKSFITLEEQLHAREEQFRKRLPSSQVDEVLSNWQIASIRNRFRNIYWSTVAIYIGIAVLSLVAAWVIPNWVASSTSAVATMTPGPP